MGLGLRYASLTIADENPLTEWVCYQKGCKSTPIKKVRSRNGLGKIALCRKHLEEYHNGGFDHVK